MARVRLGLTGANQYVSEPVGDEKLTVGVACWGTTGGRSTDPVVVDRLVSIQDGRVTLSSVDIDILDLSGHMFNTIGLNEGDIVVVDREGKEWAASNCEDAQAVSLSLFDIDHGERN
jgi:hypothetical protein